MKRLLLALLTVLAACSAERGRVGIVTPTERTVNYDPSTVDGGLAAIVGFTVYSPLGDKSWMKSGTGNSQWSVNPGTTSPLAGLAEVAYTSAAIDMTAIAATQIVPVAPAGYVFIPVRAYVYLVSVAGAETGAASIQIGNNGTTYNNVLASTATFPGATDFSAGAGRADNSAVLAFTTSSAAFFVSVTAGAAGTGGYALSCRYSLVGYWQPIP